MKDKQKGLLVGILVTIMVVAIICTIGYFVAPALDLGGGNNGGGGGGGGSGGGGSPPGTAQVPVRISSFGYSSFNTMNTFNDATNFAITYYRMLNGNPVFMGSSTGGSATVTATAADNNIIYAAVSPRAGQNLYVDFDKTAANNIAVMGQPQYFDIAGNGQRQFVYQLNIANLPRDANGVGQLWFYPYFRPQGNMILNSPADQSGIGTGTRTQYIKWEGAFTTTDVALAITKVEIEFSTGDLTKINLDNVNIPGMGFLAGTQFSQSRTSSSTLYTWQVSPLDLSGATYLMLGANADNSFSFNTRTQTNLASGESIDATITIYSLAYDGSTLPPMVDTVTLSA